MPPEDSAPESQGKTSLTGWKEIAAYLGKGVRTVQRWERELGLPVRRLTGAHAEIIYALPDELEAWRIGRVTSAEGADAGRDPDSEPGRRDDASVAGAPAPAEDTPTVPDARTDGAVSGRGPRRPARWAGLVVMAALGVFLALAWRREQPAGWKVENHALRVYSSAGKLLWEHRFEFPLTDNRYPGVVAGGQSRTTAYQSQAQPVVIDDVDGDGAREVISTPRDEEGAPALVCFNADGTIRFVHRPHYRVRFGDITYDGPWLPAAIQLTGNGRSAIWVSMHHQGEFPSVVDKLDPAGRLLGQYWNNGILGILRPAVLDGRRVVLAGGANNEFVGATLVALDEENPNGMAPSVHPYYSCRDCPPGAPVRFLVFPPTDIQRTMGTTSAVDQIRVGETGMVTLGVISDITAVTGPGGPAQGEVYYRLNPQLQVVGAEIESSFKLTHDELFRRGMLDHPCDGRDQRDLWPVLRWQGQAYERIAGPEAR